MRTIGPEFNTNRMVREYTERMYLPALDRGTDLGENGFARAKDLAVWKKHLRESWDEIEIDEVTVDNHKTLKVGESVAVRAQIDLGRLKPDDVTVEFFYGQPNAQGDIENPKVALVKPTDRPKGTAYEFVGTNKLAMSGRMGHTVRVLLRQFQQHQVDDRRIGDDLCTVVARTAQSRNSL